MTRSPSATYRLDGGAGPEVRPAPVYKNSPCACCGRTGKSGGWPPTCWDCAACNTTRGIRKCGRTYEPPELPLELF